MRSLLCFVLSSFTLLAACGEDATVPAPPSANGPAPAPSPAASSATPGPNTPSAKPGTNDVHGVIGGAPWVPTDGTARAGKGYVHGVPGAPAIDLVFGTTDNACADAKSDLYIAGRTYVAIHSVRAAIGTDEHVSDAEVFTIGSSCSQLPLDRGGSWVTSALGSDVSVTITRLDAERIEGSVKATFDDLSTFEGSFSVVPCAGSNGFGEAPMCQLETAVFGREGN